MNFRAHTPVEIEFGAGKLARLGEFAGRLAGSARARRVFLATMPEMVELGIAERALHALSRAGWEVVLFDGVRPEPKSDEIDAAAAELARARCEIVVGLGGGSAMDVAKACAIAATHPEPVWAYVNLSNRPPQPVDAARALPVIAVPTTSGTGSETTPYAVVTNSETVQKGTIKEPAIFPRIALVDPELACSMPKRLTGATGIDAFAHALESYLNTANRTPMSDLLAESALGELARWLAVAYADGRDVEARSHVAWGATLSGMVIAQAGTTVAHAIAQPLGARLGVSHAESVALFTVPVLRATLPFEAERIARVGSLLPGCEGVGEPHERAAVLAVDAIERFLASVGMNRTLRDHGGDEALVDPLAADVTTYMSRPLKQHPVLFDADGIRAIVRAALGSSTSRVLRGDEIAQPFAAGTRGKQGGRDESLAPGPAGDSRVDVRKTVP